MMFALLQEQHKAQMDAIVASNQKAMDAMFKRMNTIVGAQGRLADKENTPPTAGNMGNSNGSL